MTHLKMVSIYLFAVAVDQLLAELPIPVKRKRLQGKKLGILFSSNLTTPVRKLLSRNSSGVDIVLPGYQQINRFLIPDFMHFRHGIFRFSLL